MITKKQDKTKIVQIWGDILDQGFTSVPNILLRYRTKLGIKSHHLSLIIDIMSFKWDTENPFPSYSALAEKAGVTERGIMKTIQDLERMEVLIRTQRFDKQTGAQITTIFDFRPLVQKLTEQTRRYSVENELNIKKGGGELKIRGGMNYSSGGGMNYSSPKEYSYNNKTQINKKPLNVKKQEIENKKTKHNNPKNEKGRVHKYFRNGIFRKRLFELYDNLSNTHPVENLVREGALRACKEIIINRVSYLSKSRIKINPNQIVEEVGLEFPYKRIPNHTGSARKFFVATVCNLTAEKISAYTESE